MIFKRVLVFLLLLGAGGCVGPAPIDDLVLAQTALESARSAEAPRYAPGHWLKAEDLYQKAVQQYQDRRYNEAKGSLVEAREQAERAENAASLQKARHSGDGW